jgi:hypothetical protein
MGERSIKILESAMESIAEASWFIESKGLVATADRFSEAVYDFIEKLSKKDISFKLCREPERALLGFKCVQFKKYTVVFEESDEDIVVVEFVPSKMIKW